MDNSPLARLPLELRKQILGYIIPIDHQTNDCVEWRIHAYSREPAKSMLLWLARRNALLATCRELQSLGLHVHLRRKKFTWQCSLWPPTARTETMDRRKTWNKVLFWSLPSLQTRGYISSVGGVGAITTDDYLHRESANVNGDIPTVARHPNWIDNPLEILQIFKEAAYIAFQLRKQQIDRGLEHRQLFFKHTYRLQALTDGNAFKPIKKALRGTWKRDTVDLTISMHDEVISARRMEAAMALLDIEHREKIEAIQHEIVRQKRLPERERSENFDDQEPLLNKFLVDMNTKYSLWWRRVKKFHEGLIRVVMLGYKTDYRDVDKHLDAVQARLPQNLARNNFSGEFVVDSVLEAINAMGLDEIESKYRIEADPWLGISIS